MLLNVTDLRTYYYHRGLTIKAVDGIDFAIDEKEVLALVGESGCGKSAAALSITRLIPEQQGKIVSGEVIFEQENLLKLQEEKLRQVRGGKISYIFQEPATSLNPVFTIGEQIKEALQLHKGMKAKQALDYAQELLSIVGISSPHQRLFSYPHELSGGMKQRVMIAMALASDPLLLIADEPTTALDVTIQMQILLLLDKLRKDRGLSILLITHDLSIVNQIADNVAIMYLGKIMEYASLSEIMNNPMHPYTKGLLNCIPKPGQPKQKLASIPGNVPDPSCAIAGCRFNSRCELATEECRKTEPQLRELRPGHWVRCIKA